MSQQTYTPFIFERGGILRRPTTSSETFPASYGLAGLLSLALGGLTPSCEQSPFHKPQKTPPTGELGIVACMEGVDAHATGHWLP